MAEQSAVNRSVPGSNPGCGATASLSAGFFVFKSHSGNYGMTSENIAAWNQPQWHTAAHDWIRSQLASQQITVNGTIEQIHLQPWSTVLRVPTSIGNVFFKASVAILAHEAGFTEFLANLKMDCLPQLLAVDATRGWMIMRDGGNRLRETLIAQPDMARWEELLPIYADVQIELSKHLPRIEKLNIPNCSLVRLPELYQSILEQQDWFRIDMENGITATEYQKLNDLLPVITAKCQQLVSYNIPASIHHGDLHDGNIFYNDGQYIFFDWSDSTITHPFFSLRTAYVSAEIRFNLEENAPILNRLRDAYLIPWREFESEERLLEAFGLAQELWAISSTINWYATISHLDKSLQPEYAHILPSLAQELLSLIKES
jgi:hypothetical protein